MGFNWRAAFGGAASAVSNTAGLLITDEVSKMREARMAQYQQAQVADERSYQGEVRQETRAQNLEMMGIKGEQEAMQSAAEREQELADMDRDEQHDINMLKQKAALGIDKGVTVNNNMGESLGARRGIKTQEGMAAADVEAVTAIKSAGRGVAKVNDTLNILEELQGEFKTGKTPDIMAQVGAYLGTDAGAARQIIEGSVAPLVLDLMSQQKGPQTDADRRQFEKLMPTFDKDPKAYATMLGLLRKYTQRATANYKAVQEYEASDFYKQNGHYGNLELPNSIDQRETRNTEANINAVDDPLGMFD